MTPFPTQLRVHRAYPLGRHYLIIRKIKQVVWRVDRGECLIELKALGTTSLPIVTSLLPLSIRETTLTVGVRAGRPSGEDTSFIAHYTLTNCTYLRSGDGGCRGAIGTPYMDSVRLV